MSVVKEPPDITLGRRTVEQVLIDLETRAAASLTLQSFVSGSTRLDVEYQPRSGAFFYYVNGRADSRDETAAALVRAREAWHRKFGC